MQKEVVKSDGSTLLFIPALLFGAGCCFGLAYHMYGSITADRYWQFFEGVLFVASLAAGIWCLYLITGLDRLEITEDELIVKWFWGARRKMILLEDIQWYAEVETKNKSDVTYTLIIYAPRKKYTISSFWYDNYRTLKSALIKHARLNRDKKRQLQKKKSRLTAWAMVTGSLLVMGLALSAYYGKPAPVATSSFSDVITSEPRISKGSKGSRWINLYLAKYPEFEFEIAGDNYKNMYVNDYLANVRPGHTLYVDVATTDYEMKLAKTMEPVFWVKHNNYGTINIYGLRDNKMTYLVTDITRNNKNSGFALAFFLIIAGSVLLSGLSVLYAARG